MVGDQVGSHKPLADGGTTNLEVMSITGAPILRTDRLILRPPTLDDAEGLFHAYASDPEVTRFLRWTPKASAEEVRDFLVTAVTNSGQGIELHWVLETREGHSPIGMITAWYSEEHGAEVGFVLSRKEWGRGYMSEAAAAVVDWLLEQPSVFRVWAYCDCENAASARVLEKVGLEKEGLLRRWTVHPNISTEPRDAFIYSKVR